MSGVYVVGTCMADLVVRAPRRPAAGETLVGHSLDRFLGGKGFNQAVAAARAGAAVTFVGRVGDDEHGRDFAAVLRREGIDATHLGVDPDEGTGVGLPLVEDNGDNSIVVIPRANHGLTARHVEAATDALTRAALALVQLELPVALAHAVVERARAVGTRTLLNPAPAHPEAVELAPLVDLLVPNEGEAAALAGGTSTPVELARELRGRFGTTVVVTAGAAGVVLADADGVEEVAAHPVTAVDTVGAGDTFCGVLGARLAAGDPLRAAVRWANAAAALSVTRAGAEPAIPTRDEVDRLLHARA